jgi:hypothetical protein
MGGGVYCGLTTRPGFTNCIFDGNRAITGKPSEGLKWSVSRGGALYADDLLSLPEGGDDEPPSITASFPVLTSCLITECSAEKGGGVYCFYRSAVTLTNCIIWWNDGAAVEEMVHGLSTAAYCTIEGDVTWPGEGNTTADPLFIDLGDWMDPGTPDDPLDDTWRTGDYHLLPRSPAIDAGTSAGAPVTDIEGAARPCGKGVDLGPYETGGCLASRFVRGDADGSGKIDLNDPIYLLSHLFLGGPAPGCRDAADADDGGTLDIVDATYSLSYQFLAGPAPGPPFPGCGLKDRINDLDCKEYAGCR